MKIVENPIELEFLNVLSKTNSNLYMAVPFLSSYVRKLFSNLNPIVEKKILLRLDETNFNAYDLDSMKYLIEKGFEIRFNNRIHLKLYILDDTTIISSSNLTNSGFITNVELSVVKISDAKETKNIFEKLWHESGLNIVDLKYIEKNWSKYLILKAKERAKKTVKPNISTNIIVATDLNVNELKKRIFYDEREKFNETLNLIYKANIARKIRINSITQNLNYSIFYSPENDDNRYNCLFYDFVYGIESQLAGTGLYEYQYREAFTHKKFFNIVKYLLPEIVNSEPWNFKNLDQYYELCYGLFNLDIPQFSEALPIRLISYFYPEHFVPIFNLDHLKQICESLGLVDNAKTKGERLYVYNTFIKSFFDEIPLSNYIKSQMLYSFYYTTYLYNKIRSENLTYENVLDLPENNRNWKKDYLKKAHIRLSEMKVI